MTTTWTRSGRGDRPPRAGGRRLAFAPLAWLKLQYLCHAGPTEVAGFGLSGPADPLYLDDVLVVRQRATPVGVAFDDHAVADLFDRMADAGVPPARFARVWVHTHPGDSAVPTPTDEATFARAFGRCDWAVMAVLARSGRTTARVRFAAGPGGAADLPTAVDWAAWPAAAADPARPLADRVAAWAAEYAGLVEAVPLLSPDAMVFDDAFAEHPDPFLSPDGGPHEFG